MKEIPPGERVGPISSASYRALGLEKGGGTKERERAPDPLPEGFADGDELAGVLTDALELLVATAPPQEVAPGPGSVVDLWLDPKER
jgi:hypothetical protein